MLRRRPLLRAVAAGGAAFYAGRQSRRSPDASVDDELDDSTEQLDGPEAGAECISDDEIDQLKKLAGLKEKGVLTQTEFESQKHKILGT